MLEFESTFVYKKGFLFLLCLWLVTPVDARPADQMPRLKNLNI